MTGGEFIEQLLIVFEWFVPVAYTAHPVIEMARLLFVLICIFGFFSLVFVSPKYLIKIIRGLFQ